MSPFLSHTLQKFIFVRSNQELVFFFYLLKKIIFKRFLNIFLKGPKIIFDHASHLYSIDTSLFSFCCIVCNVVVVPYSIIILFFRFFFFHEFYYHSLLNT